MTAIKYSIILALVVSLNTTVLAQQNPVQRPAAQDQGASFNATLNFNPLYKIDSVEVSREAFERAVALRDIGSILVSKDPNATALYGGKACNGVVIVITRERPSFAEEFLSRKKRIYPSIN
jgi:TonB-dependent SusC/RagA subfamily outer membrane receptor